MAQASELSRHEDCDDDYARSLCKNTRYLVHCDNCDDMEAADLASQCKPQQCVMGPLILHSRGQSQKKVTAMARKWMDGELLPM